MQPEHGIKRSVVEVGHVSIITDARVDTIVNRLETVGVGGASGNPCRITELMEVVVVGEKVVQTVAEVHLTVGEDTVEQVVLTACRVIPRRRVSLGNIPGCELLKVRYCGGFVEEQFLRGCRPCQRPRQGGNHNGKEGWQ
jgi:hypothetical protein